MLPRLVGSRRHVLGEIVPDLDREELARAMQHDGRDVNRRKRRTHVDLAKAGASQYDSRCETKPGTNTKSSGPLPTSW